MCCFEFDCIVVWVNVCCICYFGLAFLCVLMLWWLFDLLVCVCLRFDANCLRVLFIWLLVGLGYVIVCLVAFNSVVYLILFFCVIILVIVSLFCICACLVDFIVDVCLRCYFLIVLLQFVLFAILLLGVYNWLFWIIV